MTMKVQDPNDPEKEIEVFTADEMAIQTAAATEAKTAAETARAEAEKLKVVVAEKTNNFKKLNEMTDAERTALGAEKLEAIKRFEAAEARATALEESINSDKKARVESDTASALAKYHGGDEKLKAALEENFKIINLEGTDKETIEKRAKLAADMYKGQTGRANPLMASMSGGSPGHQEKSKTEEFLGSDKAAEAMKRMGDAPAKKEEKK